jgi:hypothetical protein
VQRSPLQRVRCARVILSLSLLFVDYIRLCILLKRCCPRHHSLLLRQVTTRVVQQQKLNWLHRQLLIATALELTSQRFKTISVSGFLLVQRDSEAHYLANAHRRGTVSALTRLLPPPCPPFLVIIREAVAKLQSSFAHLLLPISSSDSSSDSTTPRGHAGGVKNLSKSQVHAATSATEHVTDLDVSEAEQEAAELAYLELDIPRAQRELRKAGLHATALLTAVTIRDCTAPLAHLFTPVWDVPQGSTTSPIAAVATSLEQRLTEMRGLLCTEAFVRLAIAVAALVFEAYLQVIYGGNIAPVSSCRIFKLQSSTFYAAFWCPSQKLLLGLPPPGFGPKFKLTPARRAHVIGEMAALASMFRPVS